MRNKKNHLEKQKIALIVLGAAALAFVGLYGVQRQESRRLDGVIERLNQQQTPAASQSQQASQTGDTSTVKTPVDTRTLLTFPYNQTNCNVKFNNDAANTTVTYTNKDEGLSVDLPYNSAWGTSKYRVNPYEVSKEDNFIAFGPLFAFEGCGWVRGYSLRFEKSQTPAQFTTAMKNSNPENYTSTTKQINGMTVIEDSEGGMCSSARAVAFGKKATYIFKPLCGMDLDKEYKLLESLIKTIKQI